MFPRRVLKEILSGRLKMHPNVPDAVYYFIFNQVTLLHEILATVNLVILKNPYLVAF